MDVRRLLRLLCDSLAQTPFPLCLFAKPERLVPQDAGQVVVKPPGLLGIVAIVPEDIDKRNQRLGYRLIRFGGRETLTHVRRHHRTIPRDELTPSGVLRISRKIAKKRL